LIPIKDVSNLSDDIMFVKAGERDAALTFVRHWFNDIGDSALVLFDPYARADDVVLLASTLHPSFLKVITGNGDPDNSGAQRTAKEALEEINAAWRRDRDDEAPEIEITVIGTAT